MTQAYFSHPTLQWPSLEAITSMIANRVTGWIRTNRVKQNRAHTISVLRTLPPETLDDLGIDAHELNAKRPSIVHANPYVIAYFALTDTNRFDVKNF